MEEVSKELQKMAKDAADVKSAALSIDKKWHAAINGRNGTTLNAIIGEERTLVIKFGVEARKLLKQEHSFDDNIIAIRGISSDVDRASKEILRIVEEAKNDEIDNSYVSLLLPFYLNSCTRIIYLSVG